MSGSASSSRAPSRGVSVSEWARAAGATMSASEMKSLAPYGLGQGIGVSPEEPPVLSADSHATIQLGMCLVLRAALTGDRGLVLHGETLVV